MIKHCDSQLPSGISTSGLSEPQLWDSATEEVDNKCQLNASSVFFLDYPVPGPYIICRRIAAAMWQLQLQWQWHSAVAGVEGWET